MTQIWKIVQQKIQDRMEYSTVCTVQTVVMILAQLVATWITCT